MQIVKAFLMEVSQRRRKSFLGRKLSGSPISHLMSEIHAEFSYSSEHTVNLTLQPPNYSYEPVPDHVWGGPAAHLRTRLRGQRNSCSIHEQRYSHKIPFFFYSCLNKGRPLLKVQGCPTHHSLTIEHYYDLYLSNFTFYTTQSAKRPSFGSVILLRDAF